MLKGLKKVIFSLMLLIGLFCISANASTPIIEYKSNNVKITSLSADSQVTVTATVSKDLQSGVLISVLYEDNKLINVAYTSSSVPSPSGEEKVYTNTIDIKNIFGTSAISVKDIAKCEINTMLWDSAESMNPICEASLFPGGVSTLKEITVDGVKIAGFDPLVSEYTVDIESKATAPVVAAKAIDGGASIRVVNPGDKIDPLGEDVASNINPNVFPGKALIQVIGADNSTKTYTINYKCDAVLVSDIALGASVPDGTATPAYSSNLETGLYLWDHRTAVYITKLDSSLVGKSYIASPGSWYGGAYSTLKGTSQISDWLNFKVDRACTVRIIRNTTSSVDHTILSDGGWNKINGNLTGTKFIETTSLSYVCEFNKNFAKDEVVSIPNLYEDYVFPYIVVFDWAGYEVNP